MHYPPGLWKVVRHLFITSPAIMVINHLWVDVEEHWHVHYFMPSQPLLLKAEALDFIEVVGRLVRHHIVSGHTSDGMRAAAHRGGSDDRLADTADT